MTVCVLTHCIFKYYMYIYYPQLTKSVTYLTCTFMNFNGLDQLRILHVYILASMDLINYIYYMYIYELQWTGSVT